MILRPGGAESGIKAYLETGQTKDRFYNRDQLDSRLILDGDLEILDSIINSIEGQGDNYYHFTLSFKEDNISELLLNDINQEFKSFISQGYTQNELYYYAEAHLPKIKSYMGKNGVLIERKPHIHIIIPRYNLLSYKNVEFQTLYCEKYYNAFQEYINQKYGLESPKDNLREYTKHSEIISRHKGDIFEGHNKELRQDILDAIIANNITTFDNFRELLIHTYTAIVNYVNVQSQQYFKILLPDNKRFIRLKDYVFSEEFIRLNNENKLKYLENIVKKEIEYIEIGKSKKINKTHLDLLSEWQLFGAIKQKYWNTFSKNKRENLKNLTLYQQVEFFKTVEQKFYSKLEDENVRFNSRTSTEYKRTISEYLQNTTHNLSTADDDFERSRRTKIDVDFARKHGTECRKANIRKMQSDRGESIANWGKSQYFGREYKPRLNQSLIDKIDIHMETEDWFVKNSKQIDQLKYILDAGTVMELVAITHGVIPDKYTIEKSRDGVDKIICGNRSYNIIDFLFKEMNFAWEESKDMLSIAYKMQQEIDRERGYSPLDSKYLWDEYVLWFEQFKKQSDQKLSAYKQEYKDLKDGIRQWYFAELEIIREKYTGYYHKINHEKRILKAERVIRENNMKNERLEEYRIRRAKANLKIQDAYREFLLIKANSGDDLALHELRRMRLDYSEYEKQGSIKLQQNNYFHHRLKIEYLVDKRGIINYTEDSKVFIRDTGKRIDAVYTSDENIHFFVELALHKFGRNIALDGTDVFKRRFIEYCIENKIEIQYADEFSKQYSQNYRLALLKHNNEAKASIPLKFESVVLADVETINNIDEAGNTIQNVFVTLIQDNQPVKLSGLHLKQLDKLPRGSLLDLVIDGAKCKSTVKEFDYLRQLNKELRSKAFDVLEAGVGNVACLIDNNQIIFNPRNKIITPGDKVSLQAKVSRDGFEYNAFKVYDSKYKKQIISNIFNDFIGEFEEKPDYVICGKFIAAGVGVDPFYRKESNYIMIRTVDGRIKSMWGKNLDTISLERGQYYILSKTGKDYNVSKVEIDSLLKNKLHNSSHGS